MPKGKIGAMEGIEVAVQIAAVVCGLYAAFLWWQSSQGVEVLSAMPPNGTPADTGNLLIHGTDGKYILYDFAKQGRLNKAAALWTAISVAFQAISIAIKLVR
ncbi:MAG TPA: hypothetical protein VJP60_01655 [Rhizomicrobium sp.]|nr:hypothetical protein [Rhizomicrobium sp.]